MAYIDLNEYISVDLGDGQFVERTDIFTEYSDKLKIYQSTTHEDNGQNFACIKVAPQCSYDIYLIANSEQNFDKIGLFEGYIDGWIEFSLVGQHNGGNDPYTKLNNWYKTQISNNTDEDKYYTVIWRKDGGVNINEDIGMFAINITSETIIDLPSKVLFNYDKRKLYIGDEFITKIKYNDVDVYNVGTVWQTEIDNGKWMTFEGWVGMYNNLIEQWNVMRPVWFRKHSFDATTSLSISMNIFYRQGFAPDPPTIDRQVNVMLYVLDSDGNRISKQKKQIPCINEIGITEEEMTAAGISLYTINNYGFYVPNSMGDTETTFNSFPDLYKVTFDDVTIPSGGYYRIFFTSVNNPNASWMIWDRNIQENIL